MQWQEVSCQEWERLRAGMRVHSACTNFVGGEVLDPVLPAQSYISHYDPDVDDEEQLRSVLDADGCRHTVRIAEPLS